MAGSDLKASVRANERAQISLKGNNNTKCVRAHKQTPARPLARFTLVVSWFADLAGRHLGLFETVERK